MAACAFTPGSVSDTTRAPAPGNTSRRLRWMFMVHLPSCLRRALDGAQDADMGAAAAFQARQRVADLGVGRPRILVEQRDRGHDPAVEAVAALRHLFLDEGRLHL